MSDLVRPDKNFENEDVRFHSAIAILSLRGVARQARRVPRGFPRFAFQALEARETRASSSFRASPFLLLDARSENFRGRHW